MNNMIWLIRREIWENRSLWIAPLVIAGVILVTAAFGGIHVGDGDFSVRLAQRLRRAHSEHDRPEHPRGDGFRAARKKQVIYAITLSTFTAVQLFAMTIVLFFYLLDCRSPNARTAASCSGNRCRSPTPRSCCPSSRRRGGRADGLAARAIGTADPVHRSLVRAVQRLGAR